jgi:hypothetical protein
MGSDERYAEAERIALRMGFHPAFTRAAAAQGEAAEVARARSRSRATRATRATRVSAPVGRPWSAARLAWTVRVRRSAPLGCRP